MAERETGSQLVSVVVVLLAVAILAPLVRGMTAELNGSVGRVWPFSHSHCRARTTPGCAAAYPGSLAEAPSPQTGHATR